MLLTELVDAAITGPTHSEDEWVGLNRRARAFRRELVRYMPLFKHFRNELKRLGVTTEERADVRLGQIHAHLRTKSDDRKIASVASAAAAMGIYYGVLMQKFEAMAEEIPKHRRSKKAGAAGGNARTIAKETIQKEIRETYARWADDPKNSHNSVAAFAKSLAAEKKAQSQATGFSQATIVRAITSLNEEILSEWQRIGPANTRRANRDKAIAAAMHGRPGISAATIRRAFD